MRGLPQKRAYETVSARCHDSGFIRPSREFTSAHGAGSCLARAMKDRTWQKILEGLPSVVCVRNAVVEDASGAIRPALVQAAATPSHQTKSSPQSKTHRSKLVPKVRPKSAPKLRPKR